MEALEQLVNNMRNEPTMEVAAAGGREEVEDKQRDVEEITAANTKQE